MVEQGRRHVVYVLRVWLGTSNEGQRTWRALLEAVQTGERHGFTRIRQLAALLEQQGVHAPPRGAPACQPPRPPPPGVATAAARRH